MQKRGPIVGFIGVIITMASFLVVLSIFPSSDPLVNGEMLVPDFLEGMFTQVSDEILIFPGDSNSFSYSSLNSEVPLLWGAQIIDFQPGDEFSVHVSNIYGDDFGTVHQEGPVLFDMLMLPASDVYNFQVENTGAARLGVCSAATNGCIQRLLRIVGHDLERIDSGIKKKLAAERALGFHYGSNLLELQRQIDQPAGAAGL